jgi:hypothetical protein
MNRRGFLTSILKAGVAAMVMPSAVTYARQWKLPASRELFIQQYEIVIDHETGLTLLYRQAIMADCMRAFRSHLSPLAQFSEKFNESPNVEIVAAAGNSDAMKALKRIL